MTLYYIVCGSSDMVAAYDGKTVFFQKIGAGNRKRRFHISIAYLLKVLGHGERWRVFLILAYGLMGVTTSNSLIYRALFAFLSRFRRLGYTSIQKAVRAVCGRSVGFWRYVVVYGGVKP